MRQEKVELVVVISFSNENQSDGQFMGSHLASIILRPLKCGCYAEPDLKIILKNKFIISK